ncbi:MAG TPA: flagellar export chaperone FliS [Fontimonas sp.]
MSYATAVRQYQSVSSVGAVADASPHKLVSMLYAGLLERLASARGALMRGDVGTKARQIGAAVAIVEHLRVCLDREAGGALASNLDALYEYMTRRLVKANADNDEQALDEVMRLSREIQSGWEGIAR